LVVNVDVLSHNPLSIYFRRTSWEDKLDAWFHLVQWLMHEILSNENDKFVWKLTTSENFTVKSMYADFMN
jgi:hypothetical protein